MKRQKRNRNDRAHIRDDLAGISKRFKANSPY
nr:ribosome modulation factor [Colwellia sp. D2M02]